MVEPLFHQVCDLSELISKARAGFSSESRAQWYPRLPKIVLDGTEVLDMSYSDLLLTCEKKFKNDVNAYELERKIRGVPIDLRSKLNKGKLDRPGVEKVYDVITILSFRYRISSEDIYLVEPLVFHVAAAVRRIDACFSACSDMIRKCNWYITATMLEHRVKIFSFQDLLEVVMPATYRCLKSLKALADEFLNNIFVGLFFSLLPREQAYRILDSFLLEGGKVLYRYGIALLSMFKTDIKSGRYQTGEQFWADVAITCNSTNFNFEELHSLAFDRKSKSFFKMLSRKRKINRRNICELKNQIRDPLEKSMALTKNSSGTLKLSTDICILAAVSTWFDRALWSQSTILDTTMAIKLQLYLAEALHPQTPRGREKDGEKELGRYNTLPPLSNKLPGAGPSVQNLRLVFSSARHGRSLTSLYEMVGGRSPCILLLRSMHKQAVIGVYVSCAIAPCHRAGSSSQRGDHSCFCFRLNSVAVPTGSSSPVSLNAVSFFKSAHARQHPPPAPSVIAGDSDDEGEPTGRELEMEWVRAVGEMPYGEEVEGTRMGLDQEFGGNGDFDTTRRYSTMKEGVAAGVREKDKERDRDRDRDGPASFNSGGGAEKGVGNRSGVIPEPYTMASYVEHVKTAYIAGDASVLMFGATASRQPLNAIRLDRELRMCYTASSETFSNPNLVPEECSPFPVDVVEVYAGNFLDADVDISLIGDADGREGNDKMTVKTEKGSVLSTMSSSAYTSVNPACSARYSEKHRLREEGTVQAQESYSYGSCRRPPPGPQPPALAQNHPPLPPTASTGAGTGTGSLPVSGRTSQNRLEKEREKDSEYSYNDGDIDRPWDDDKSRTREEDDDDPDAHKKFLALTPANLGSMPQMDEDYPEAPRREEGMPIPAMKARTLYWEDGEETREKYKENIQSEEAGAGGDAHFVRQSINSLGFIAGSSQGARRDANGCTPSGGEDSLYIGYRRRGYGQQERVEEPVAVAVSSASKTPKAELARAEVVHHDTHVVDASNTLNYESAGYRLTSTFEGTNTMNTDQHGSQPRPDTSPLPPSDRPISKGL